MEALLGEWSIEVSLPGAPEGDIGARVTFEWLPGEKFLLQRWQIPVPEAPDGLAVIGYDEGRGTLLQHYFDSRGVARVYEMTFADGTWTLYRAGPDWPQRYVGRMSEDTNTITGAWERGDEPDAPLQHDFDLNFSRVR